MKTRRIAATRFELPLEAPGGRVDHELPGSPGAIVEAEADDGLPGLGEAPGAGSATQIKEVSASQLNNQHPAHRRPVEWPTWLLVLAIYGAWIGLVLGYRSLSPLFVLPALVVVTAWFMSLQHELLHGHPTRNKAFNRLLGLFPLSAWYPYDVYRDSHLAHHRDELLTTPGVDPESNYVRPEVYLRMNPWQRFCVWSMRTVLGRFLVGPGITIPAVWADLFAGVRERGWTCVRTWALHIVLLVAMLWWLQDAAGINPWLYLFGIAYPALGLAMLRSFYEHRPTRAVGHRIVINEAGWFWRLLYLNNNYHSVHHAVPALAWYRIPALWRERREQFLADNGEFHLTGYGGLFWRHALRPVDSPVHPGFGDPGPGAGAAS